MKNVYAISGVKVPLIVDSDGTPQCSAHGHSMVEVDPNVWQCPWAKEAEDELGAALGAYFATHTDEQILGHGTPERHP